MERRKAFSPSKFTEICWPTEKDILIKYILKKKKNFPSSKGCQTNKNLDVVPWNTKYCNSHFRIQLLTIFCTRIPIPVNTWPLERSLTGSLWMKPGGCKQFLAQLIERTTFSCWLHFFPFPNWYCNCKEFFRKCGTNQKREAMRRMEMRKNNLAAENRNLKGNANRWTSGKKN